MGIYSRLSLDLFKKHSFESVAIQTNVVLFTYIPTLLQLYP